MNTEIFDYIKELSKKEFFFANSANTLFSAIIIIASIISLRYGATMNTYAVMFGSATMILFLNGYKSFRRKKKNVWIFIVAGVVFAAITAIAIFAIIQGGNL